MKKQIVMTLLLFPQLGHSLTLNDYLAQVGDKNGTFRSNLMSQEAKELRRDEGSLMFRPSLFISGEYYDDQRPTNAPTFQGTQTVRHTLKGGLSQNFRTGTKAAISYNYYKTEIVGANPTLLPRPTFFDVAPTLEFSQSLWRNFMGAEFEAGETVQNAQTEAQRWSDQFQYKQLHMQAKNAYWRLYFAQRSLKVQDESLERAKKLREWLAGRVRNNLVDESELFQAEANLQNRQMEYQDTWTEVTAALGEFNSLREENGEVNLDEDDQELSEQIFNSEVPRQSEAREDVKAAMALQKLAAANAQLGTQRNKPNLELYGTYSINGRDSNYSGASDQAIAANRPFSIVGLKFTTPLDLGSLSDYKSAYAKETVASELNYKRRSFEVEKEWEILSERFANLKKRYDISKKLEKAQEKKLVYEKRRYGQGRTTTFQVLQFEQDYANTQLLKIRNQRELITVYNQLMLFAGASHE